MGRLAAIVTDCGSIQSRNFRLRIFDSGHCVRRRSEAWSDGIARTDDSRVDRKDLRRERWKTEGTDPGDAVATGPSATCAPKVVTLVGDASKNGFRPNRDWHWMLPAELEFLSQ